MIGSLLYISMLECSKTLLKSNDLTYVFKNHQIQVKLHSLILPLRSLYMIYQAKFTIFMCYLQIGKDILVTCRNQYWKSVTLTYILISSLGYQPTQRSYHSNYWMITATLANLYQHIAMVQQPIENSVSVTYFPDSTAQPMKWNVTAMLSKLISAIYYILGCFRSLFSDLFLSVYTFRNF